MRPFAFVALVAFGCFTLQAAKVRSVSPSASTRQSINRHLLNGKQLGAAGKWKEAESELRAFKYQNPDSTEAVSLHAESLIKIHQPFDAVLELQEFLQQHPKALRAHELYAVLAADPLKDVTLAASELETCVRLSPRDFQAWESLGDTYLDQAKAEQAVRAYSSAFRLRPDNPLTAASLAHAYAEQGLSEKAAAQFKLAIELARRPGQPRESIAVVEYLRGVYLAEHGSGEESVNALTKALAFNPKSAEAYYWRARAYEKLKNNDHAEADALKAIELAPASKEAPLFLITLYHKSGDMEKARKYADMAQKITEAEQTQTTFGRSLRDTLDKAEPLLREGRFTEAIPLYESIVKLLPTFYEAYFDLGTCYGQTGHLDESETVFKKYLSFQSVSADGHAALGIVLAEQGKDQEAVPELVQALQIDPSMGEVRKALANEYLKETNPKAAIAVLEVAKDTKDVEMITMLANALDKNGDYSSAMTVINRALTLQPADAQALHLEQELLSRSTGSQGP